MNEMIYRSKYAGITFGARSYIFLYLAAIVIANLSVAWFGPAVVILNAFLFIGLDLTARDTLHDAWHGRRLGLKMAGLTAAGSALSWLLNRNAGPVAPASFIAFAAAAMTDALVYHRLLNQSKLLPINGSNIPAALVDSIIFPTLAFGSFMLPIVAGQFIAKVAGGFVWSLILNWLGRKEVSRA